MMKMKFDINMLPTDIYFVYGRKNHYKFMLDKFKVENQIEKCGSTTELTKKDQQILVISVAKIKDIYSLKAMVVHEITHAADWLMRYYGIDDEEFRAYANQFMYQTIMPQLDKWILK